MMQVNLMKGLRKKKRINSELFKKHFNIQRPSVMLKEVYNTNDKNKNNKFVNVIKNGLVI